MPLINYNGKSYEWTRFNDGEGHWLYRDRVVHLALDHDLTIEARRQGLQEQYDFLRNPPKPKREPVARVSSGPKKSRTAVRIKVGGIRVG